MPDIQITVKDKIAQTVSIPHIVCGNNDYTAAFDFDNEWSEYTAKTMRVAYCRNGTFGYQDVLFEGTNCVIPAVYGVSEIAIGVYAGDIRTTTPARIPCMGCITDGEPIHATPPPDVYNQLLEYLAQIAHGGGSGGDQGLIARDQTINDSALLIPVVIGTPVYEEEENDL